MSSYQATLEDCEVVLDILCDRMMYIGCWISYPEIFSIDRNKTRVVMDDFFSKKDTIYNYEGISIDAFFKGFGYRLFNEGSKILYFCSEKILPEVQKYFTPGKSLEDDANAVNFIIHKNNNFLSKDVYFLGASIGLAKLHRFS
jgi:hypothetical protein